MSSDPIARHDYKLEAEDAAGTNGSPNRALLKAGRELKEALTEVEKSFRTPPGSTKGTQRSDNGGERAAEDDDLSIDYRGRKNAKKQC